MFMHNLTVYQRLALIIATLSLAMITVSGAQIMVLRSTVIEERKTAVREIVDITKTVLANFDEKAKAGKVPAEEARRLAFDAIGAMRWGQFADYVGIYGAGTADAGMTYVHANPKYVNVNRWDFKDNEGRLLIRDIVGAARAGGGYVDYVTPRATGGAELAKVAYVGSFGSDEQLLAIQAGVYIDDVDATVFRHAVLAGVGGLAGLVIAGLIALLLGRGLTRPLATLCGTIDRLAGGDVEVDVPFTERRNEIGRIAHGLESFKHSLAEAGQLRTDQAEHQQHAESEKRNALTNMADTIESETRTVLEQIHQRTKAMTTLADANGHIGRSHRRGRRDCRQCRCDGAGQCADGCQCGRTTHLLDPPNR